MASKLLLFFITFLPAFVFVCSTENLSNQSVRLSKNVFGDILRIFSLNRKCLSRGLFECLQFKFLKAIDTAVKTTDVLEVTHGVYFVRNPDIAAYNGSDPRALLDSRVNVTSFLMEKVREFLRTHLLQINFPMGRSLNRTGRKKPLKKLAKGPLGPIIFALALSGVLTAAFNVSVIVGTVVLPVILGGMALIAVIVAKVAFVLAGVAGVKTIVPEEHERIKIITKELPVDYGGNGWEKQMQGKESAQNLAYSSYIPENVIPNSYFPH